MEPITPSVIALHGSLVELTLRLGRVEECLGLHAEPKALATFARVPVPPPFEPLHPINDAHTAWAGTLRVPPCSCDEAVALRAEVEALKAKLALLEPIGGAR